MSNLNDSINYVISDVLKDVLPLKSTQSDEDFYKYYIRLISLNPQYGKYFNKSTNRDSIKSFLKSSIDKILNNNSPSILTLKMQVHFERNYDSSENLVMENQNNIKKKTEPLLKEIIQAKPNNKEELEKLLRRVSIFLILKSGLGNPGQIQVLREGTAALHSIFTMNDLRAFIDSRSKDKERQLEELLTIVSGIRIFNKDCGKGGESIPELSSNLSEAVEATSLALSHCLIRIMERVNLLTTSIDSYISISIETKSVTVDTPEDRAVRQEDYNTVCKILTVYRQYEVFVRKLISDMDRIHIENKELMLNFSGQLYDLHALVRYRTAVPADQVFPFFIQLWLCWKRMQDDMFLVSTINSIMWNLDTIHEQMEAPHTVIDALLNGRRVVSDAQRIQQTEDFKIEMPISKCQMVYPNEKMLNELALQYLGFCGLCICKGALIPANPNMGLCKWAGKLYAFCVPEHGKHFGLNPDRYIKETLEYTRNNPEMVNFLQIFNDIYAVRQIKVLAIKHIDTIQTEEKAVQTELHPIPTHIDKDYSWNIWDYKRKACHLANIMNRKTHSTQTRNSHKKLEFGCQTENWRHKSLQTTRDQASATLDVNTLIQELKRNKDTSFCTIGSKIK